MEVLSPPVTNFAGLAYTFSPNTSESYHNVTQVFFQRHFIYINQVPTLLANLLQWSSSLKLIKIDVADIILENNEALSQFDCEISADFHISHQDLGKILPMLTQLRNFNTLAITLNLQLYQYTELDLRDLAGLKFLSTLSLSCSHHYNHPYRVLPLLNFEVLSHFKNLKVLQLQKILISKFSPNQQPIPSLEQLMIKSCNLTQGITCMFSGMVNLQKIVYTDSSSFPFDQIIEDMLLGEFLEPSEGGEDGTVEALPVCLENYILEKMRVMHQSEPWISEIPLVNVLRRIPFTKQQLQEKIRVKTRQPRETVDQLVRALAYNNAPIKSMFILSGGISDTSVLQIVGGFPGLESLSLGHCKVTDKGVIAIARLTNMSALSLKSRAISHSVILKLLHNLKGLLALNCVVTARDSHKSAYLPNWSYYKDRLAIQRLVEYPYE